MSTARSLCWPLLAVVLALSACSVAVADTAIVSERPTPLSWQQWEPPKDDLDRRLAATVAAWEPEITVADLLRRLSEQTGVPLSTTADLGDCEATVYLRQHSLRGVMIGLTHAFGSYWAYRRGQAPGAAVDLDELAAALADLDLGQVDRLSRAVPALQDLPAHQLRFYGLLTAEQRERMASNEGARAAELPPDQQQEVWLFARSTHPWLEREDLGQVVLRILPRALSTGDRGFSLIVEYHLPDSPNDRDIFLTSPLSLHLPDRRGAEE